MGEIRNDHQPIVDASTVDSVLAMPIAEVISELSAALGPKLLAYIGDVSHTVHVRAWKNGLNLPRGIRDQALRAALQAARIILFTYTGNVARVWMLGSNGSLNGESPAHALRSAVSPAECATVVRAAWNFVTN